MTATATRVPAEDPHVGDVWVYKTLIITVTEITGNSDVWPGRMVHFTKSPGVVGDRVRRIGEWPHRVAGLRYVRNDPLPGWLGWDV